MREINAFTLIETLVVIGILIVLALLVIPILDDFQSEISFKNTTQEIISLLRLARAKTLASEGPGQWGVFFSTSTIPQEYILFQGSDYANRNVSLDKKYFLPESIEFQNVDFQGGNQIIFNQKNGNTNLPGIISIVFKSNPARSSTVYVESSGRVFLDSILVSDTTRFKDSRHVHLDYGRDISTTSSSTKIILTFDEGKVQKEITFIDHIQGGEFFWEGEVDVEGSVQKLKIHTHQISPLNTQFCIHRDRRFNDKILEIDISCDPDYPSNSPTLIRYEADGTTVEGNSIYVSQPIWQ